MLLLWQLYPYQRRMTKINNRVLKIETNIIVHKRTSTGAAFHITLRTTEMILSSVCMYLSYSYAEPPRTGPGLRSGITRHELISTLKKKKKSTCVEWMVQPSPQNPHKGGKCHHHAVLNDKGHEYFIMKTVHAVFIANQLSLMESVCIWRFDIFYLQVE